MSNNRHQITLVGPRIRQLRKDRDLTQAELASRVGIQQSDLCRMETGEYRVSLESLFKILKIFEMNIAEFFHITPTGSLTTDEQELLTLYRSLPANARQQVRGLIRYFAEQQVRRPRRVVRRHRSIAP